MKKIETTLALFSGIGVGAFIAAFISCTAMLQDVYMIAFTGAAAGLMTIFLDFLISPNQIFGFWQNVLKRISESKYKTLAKPLGTCIYCMNVYVYVACFLVLYSKTGVSFWYLVPGAAVSHVVLAYVERKINS